MGYLKVPDLETLGQASLRPLRMKYLGCISATGHTEVAGAHIMICHFRSLWALMHGISIDLLTNLRRWVRCVALRPTSYEGLGSDHLHPKLQQRGGVPAALVPWGSSHSCHGTMCTTHPFLEGNSSVSKDKSGTSYKRLLYLIQTSYNP